MSGNISVEFRNRARPVFNLIDDLRKIGVHKRIPIPQIAVMGDQSSGKSSVLESISGISFPRGAGLCTRCPTQVTMSEGRPWSATVLIWKGTEHRVVKHLRESQKARIPKIIEALTTTYAGEKSTRGFCPSDIYIEINLVAPYVSDLTIVDLPGIVRTTTSGQKEEVRKQVDEILDSYLQQERTVILAVIPANVDIATVDILERASRVDPEGTRTIGVLTKPDLVDKGAEGEVIEVLTNRAKPLKHGYYMMKNPSQKEIDNNASSASWVSESIWLDKSKYSNVPGISRSRLGVAGLTKALTGLLVDHIKAVLPDLESEIAQVLKDTLQELKQLGKPPPKSAAACRSTTWEIIQRFSESLLETTSEANPIEEGTSCEMEGVLQKENILRKTFVKAIQDTRPDFECKNMYCTIEILDMADGAPSKSDITKLQSGHLLRNVVCDAGNKVGDVIVYATPEGAVYNAKIIEITFTFRGEISKRMQERRGRELPGFLSFPVFSKLVSEYVEKWKEPTQEFHNDVRGALEQASKHFLSVISEAFPRLADKMQGVLNQHFREISKSTSKRLAEALALEEERPSTENHYFFDTINKIRNDRLAKKIQKISFFGSRNIPMVTVETVCALLNSDVGNCSNESQSVQDMIDMLSAYWKLASKRYIDVVGMIVTASYTCPKHMKVIEKKLSNALVMGLNEAGIQNLYVSSPERQLRRQELMDTEKAMRDAQKRLREGILLKFAVKLSFYVSN